MEISLSVLIWCLWNVESGGDDAAVNGDCVGRFQLRPCFVEDCNRINEIPVFRLEDRADFEEAWQMVYTWLCHYRRPSWNVRDAALTFKLGPTGYREKKRDGVLTTDDLDYADRVERLYREKAAEEAEL